MNKADADALDEAIQAAEQLSKRLEGDEWQEIEDSYLAARVILRRLKAQRTAGRIKLGELREYANILHRSHKALDDLRELGFHAEPAKVNARRLAILKRSLRGKRGRRK